MKINDVLNQFEGYSKEIRNCHLPSELNGHSPDQYFQVLKSIETSLQSIRVDALDSAIDTVCFDFGA